MRGTYDSVLREVVSMRRPHVPSRMLPEGCFGRRCNKLECSRRVRPKSNAGTDLAESWRRFVDMDVDMGILEETDGEA